MSLAIEPHMPQFRSRGAHSPEFEALAGATIVRIGTVPELRLEGGGLVIEYRRPGEPSRTLKLAFNECGMWIDS